MPYEETGYAEPYEKEALQKSANENHFIDLARLSLKASVRHVRLLEKPQKERKSETWV
jgi:hypothetical protein